MANLCPYHEGVHGPFDPLGSIVREGRIVHSVRSDVPVEALDDVYDIHLSAVMGCRLLRGCTSLVLHISRLLTSKYRPECSLVSLPSVLLVMS